MIGGRIADTVLDRVFEKPANDLVVPEPGVYGDKGATGFPILGEHLVQVPAGASIMHTALFGYPPVVAKLTKWLS